MGWLETTWGIDATAAFVRNLPMAPPVIWAYVTGTTQNPDIEWTPGELAEFPHTKIYRIDQGFGSKGAFDADEFDIEAGAWTPAEMVDIVRQRNAREWSTRMYAGHTLGAQTLANLVENNVSDKSVYWRVADWSVNEAEARALLTEQVYAWQWASPSSNPDTVVPGTSMVLRIAQSDLNVINLGRTVWQG